MKFVYETNLSNISYIQKKKKRKWNFAYGKNKNKQYFVYDKNNNLSDNLSMAVAQNAASSYVDNVNKVSVSANP